MDVAKPEGQKARAPRNLQERIGGAVRVKVPPLVRKLVAEACGLYFIVLLGTGVGHVGAFVDSMRLWEVAMVWAFAIAVAIYATSSVSGAHLNPAVTLAFAIFKADTFPLKDVLPYMAAQLLGATLAAFTNYAIFSTAILNFETKHNITRGSPNSIASAKVYGEYYPNPGPWHYPGEVDGLDDGWVVGSGRAMLIEAWGTAILIFAILAINDERNTALKSKDMGPLFIGFTIAVLTANYAPLTQCCLNPARDFGPRLAAACLGWGTVALPGLRHGYWVYIVGPFVGAPLGALVYSVLIEPGLPEPALEGDEAEKEPVFCQEFSDCMRHHI